MKVLIVGGGGREHAIAWKLSQSSRVSKIYCAPGNAGIAEVAECVSIGAEDIAGLCRFASETQIDLAVIGPEVPLAMGITDHMEAAGIRVFGPDANCAQLEASKAFTKAFLERHGIPTARYSEYTSHAEALKAIGIYGWPMVIKADGLAAGKGVIIAENAKDARDAIDQIMGDRIFGDSGNKLVIEEFLTGTEASILCFVDEHTILPMESAQDYKKIYDGDKGPNTGGMGTYSPSLIYTEILNQQIREQILDVTLEGFQKDGLKYKGILFIGIMITEIGPKVIEFNTRFGDPETQSVLVRMKTDLLDIFESVIDNRLASQPITWKEEAAVCVILASEGYPGNYEKGKEISGFEQLDPGMIVFHSGTKKEGDKILTAGGRVLGLVALGKDVESARNSVYDNIEKLHFKGVQYRKDIGRIIRK